MGPKKEPYTNVVELPPHPGKLMDEIRARAKKRNNIRLKVHALEQQHERSDIVSITMQDVHRVLDKGSIEPGSIKPGKNPGEWKAIVGFRPKGERKVCLVTIVKSGTDKLYIVTVMWRDTL